MKVCGCCGYSDELAQPHCVLCGEASWILPEAEPEAEPIAEPEAEQSQPAKRGRRK